MMDLEEKTFFRHDRSLERGGEWVFLDGVEGPSRVSGTISNLERP